MCLFYPSSWVHGGLALCILHVEAINQQYIGSIMPRLRRANLYEYVLRFAAHSIRGASLD